MRRELVGLIALGLVGGVVGGLALKSAQPRRLHGKIIPAQGALKFPKSANPGNPENAVEDLKRFYWALDQYRTKTKRLPGIQQFLDVSKPLAPGIRLRQEDFENPDDEFWEIDVPPGAKRPPVYQFHFYSVAKPKPGSPLLKYLSSKDWNKPVFPKAGEKRLWANTSIYSRSNQRDFPDGSRTMHKSGYEVVLWSNGSIEKIPVRKMLFTRESDKLFRIYHPGDFGVPKDARPMTDYWKEQNRRAGKTFITWD